jgi:peptidoglycan/LPS O-acetylase OafA/YrhL
MKPATSSYLDLLRVVAAFFVLLHHYMPRLYGWSEDSIAGHDAVIIFFVLSGFVVAYAAEFRDKDLGTYLISRLSRLWSVGIPALALGVLVAGLLAEPDGRTWAGAIGAALLNLVFLGEGWTWEVFAPGNAPYWSINYEAWYYVAFGLAFYLRAPWRAPALMVTLLLAGPKILLLLPIWAAGVLLFRYRVRLVVSPTAAAALLVASLLLLVLASQVQLTLVSREWLRTLTGGYSYLLGPSTAIIGDYLLLPIICANIVAAMNLGGGFGRAFERYRPAAAQAASFTLSIYLFHMPLYYLFAEVAPRRFGLALHPTLTFLLCMLGIVALGLVTEHKRHVLRDYMRRGIPSAWLFRRRTLPEGG